MEDSDNNHEFNEDEIAVADALLQLQTPPMRFPLAWGSQRQRSGGRLRRLFMSELIDYSPVILLYSTDDKSYKKNTKYFFEKERDKVKEKLLDDKKRLQLKIFLLKNEFDELLEYYHKKKSLNLMLKEKKLTLNSKSKCDSQSLKNSVHQSTNVSQDDHQLHDTLTVVTIPCPHLMTHSNATPHFESPSGPLKAEFSFHDLKVVQDESHCNNDAVSTDMQQDMVNNEAATVVVNSNDSVVSMEVQPNMVNNEASVIVANNDKCSFGGYTTTNRAKQLIAAQARKKRLQILKEKHSPSVVKHSIRFCSG